MLSEERIKELIKDYYKSIYGFCLSQLENIDDAQDATQNAFSLLIERADKLEDRYMRAWLFEVASREVFNIRRQRKYKARFFSFEENYDKIVTLEDTGFSLENESVSEESIIDKKEKILGDLSDSEKKLYKMIYIDNLKQREVAEKLGISLKAVSVRSFRLREKIKKLAEAAFSAILMLFMNFAF